MRSLGLLLVAALPACGGYAKSIRPVRDALERGNRQGALQSVNKQLDVKTEKELPKKFEQETALLLLERGMILQAMRQYEISSNDLQTAEKHLELLDLSKDTAGSIGKYLYSDDATVYRAPAYEKLLLSTQNMINYLARGDLNGARIESRRLTVTQNYLKNEVGADKAKFGLGSYLAGFAFEKSSRADEAIRYYDEALQARKYRTLDLPIARLAQAATYSTKRIEEVAGRVGEGVQPIGENEGEILIVMQSGLVPRKQAERIPVGIAFAIAYDVTHPQYAMSPAQRANANKVIARSLLKFINFPSLKKRKQTVFSDSAVIGQQHYQAEMAMDVQANVIEAYEAVKPLLIVSAVTRMVTRALVGYGTEKVAGGGVGGLLLGLAVEGAMAAKDTPDTRSWTTLPAEVSVVRAVVPAGKIRVEARFRSSFGAVSREETIDLPPGGFRVLSFFEPR